MKQICLYFFALLCLAACRKVTEEKIEIIQNTSKDLQLNIDQVHNDSTIDLKWSRYTGSNFKKYFLSRSATYLKGGIFTWHYDVVDSTDNINDTSFTETNMPLSLYVNYRVNVILDTFPTTNLWPTSNNVMYTRKRGLIYANPNDILLDSVSKLFYVIDASNVYVMDYSGKAVNSKAFPMKIGYSALGDFHGQKELYIPGSDGWLLILDPVTLDQIDRIYVGGYAIGSVVATNGKLFVSSSESTGSYDNCVRAYDRSTKQLLSRTGYWPNTRLMLVKGTGIEMIDISINLIPVGLFHYQFTAAGLNPIRREDTYHGDYLMSDKIAKVFPDGSRFITSSNGTVFNKSLVFERYMGQYYNYGDFEFNDDVSVIFASYQAEKKIAAIAYPGGNITQTIPTGNYPCRLFRDGNKLICVSKDTQFSSGGYLFIEQFNL